MDLSQDDAMELLGLMTAHWKSRALYSLCYYRVPDLIASGTSTPESIATARGINADLLRRLLRALAAEGLFIEHDDDSFSLSKKGEYFVSTSAHSLHYAVLTYGGLSAEAWQQFPKALRDGEPPFPEVAGKPFYDWLESDSNQRETFQRAMTGLGRTIYSEDAIASAINPQRFPVIADVAGGHGSLLERMLRLAPTSKGILLDLPKVIPQAKEVLKNSDVFSRLEFHSGSFFDPFPFKADMIVLKRIVHNWTDDNAVRLFDRCREALNPAGVLMIVDFALPEANEPSFGYWLDLNMFTLFGGRERRGSEFAALLEQAGLNGVAVRPTGTTLSIIEAQLAS